MFKWAGMPYWQAAEGVSQSERHLGATWEQLKGGIPFGLILPAVSGGFFVPARVERQLALVQAIEAIGMYAADHNGTLPPNLEAITDAPVPIDPVTGKTFGYKLEGTTATLTAPAPARYPNIAQYRIHYELKLAR